MGTTYALICVDDYKFIDLHKWPVIDAVADCLAAGYGVVHRPFESYRTEIIPGLCTSPLVRVANSDLIRAVDNQETTGYADYIQKLIPVVRQWTETAPANSLFICNDMGPRPWQLDQPQWFAWREITTVFHYRAAFLPRNLVDAYQFTTWQEVLTFYEDKEPWFLHPQCREELEQIRHHFEKLVATRKHRD